MSPSQRAPIVVSGGAVGAVGAIAIAAGQQEGIESLWPVLLGAGVALAPGPVLSRFAGLVVGVAVGWVAVGAQLAALPDTTTGRSAAGLAAIAVLVGVAVLTHARLPLWTMLVGAGAYLALAGAGLAIDPVAFAADRVGALGTVLLGLGAGAAAVVVARSALVVWRESRGQGAAPPTADGGEPGETGAAAGPGEGR